jgi:hypothetical protein
MKSEIPFDPERWQQAQDNADRMMRGLDPLSVECRDILSAKNFYGYMPMHNYIYAPTRETWPASSVNARIPPIGKMSASEWIDKNQPVEQLSWIPGKPMLIKCYIISDGGWIKHQGNSVFNLYRAPTITPGNPDQAGHWIDHVNKVYPNDAKHMIQWLAHRVQKPGEKINHALVMGGAPLVGKDTIHYLAASPDVLRCDEKNMREYSVPNICGVIITTNYKTDGIYLPGDDRRHYVAWCDLTKENFSDNYWNQIYRWYENGGYENVAAYLAKLDLSEFDPKAPPLKTPTFWAIVDARRAPEDADLADVLDQLGNPDAVTLRQIINRCEEGDFRDWLKDRKNRRQMPYRFEKCGYVPVRNKAADDGLWKIEGRRQAVYGKAGLSLHDRLRAVSGLAGV